MSPYGGLLGAIELKLSSIAETKVKPKFVPNRQDTSRSLTYPRVTSTMCWITHIELI